MSDAAITALSAIALALINGFFYWLQHKKVTALKTEINGRMTQLIESKEDAATAKGEKKGRAEQKAEDKKK